MRSPFVRGLVLLALLGSMAVAGVAATTLTITSGPNYGTFALGDVQSALSATGGTGPYTWTVTSGTLPAGTYIRTGADMPSFFPTTASAGIIGVATATGTSTFTLTVTDATSATATQAATLVVTPLNFFDQFQLSDGFVGVNYTRNLVTTGNSGAVTLTLGTNSALPGGLSLVNGTISGSPNTIGNFNFTIVATDNNGSISKNFNLNVYGPGIVGSSALGNVVVGTAITPITFVGQGGAGAPYSFSANFIPGLTMSSTGTLSGTPTGNNGSYQFNVTVTDTAGHSYSRNYAITYIGSTNGSSSLPSIGFPGLPADPTVGVSRVGATFSVNGGKAPYTWNATGLPSTWSLVTTNLTPGNNDTQAQLQGFSTSVGPMNTTITVTDSSTPPVTISLPFTLNISGLDWDAPPNSGTRGVLYNNTATGFYERPIGGTAPYTWAILSGGTPLPNGMTLNPNTGFISGTPLENGQFNPRIQITSSAASGSLTLTRQPGIFINSPTTPSISINTNSLPDAVLNASYPSQQLNACCVANGNTINWTVSTGALPTGLSLSTSGLISGTPTVSGVVTFTVQATDSSNPQNFGLRQLTINATPINISVNLPNGNLNVAYPATLFTATGGTAPYTFALQAGSQLPQGLSLTTQGGLSGTPTTEGSFSFTVVASDNAGHTRAGGFFMQIFVPGGGPTLSITTGSNLGTFRKGTIQYALNASGGTGSYTWSVTGTLPTGLALRTDVPSIFNSSQTAGLIGVATTTGNYSFTLQVTSGIQTASLPVTMRITNLDIQDTFSSLPDAFINTAYTYNFSAIGAAAGTTFSVSNSPGLATAGFSLSSAGVLTGTPTAAGNVGFNVSLTDGTDTIVRNFNLFVSGIQITTSGQLPKGLSQNNWFN